MRRMPRATARVPHARSSRVWTRKYTHIRVPQPWWKMIALTGELNSAGPRTVRPCPARSRRRNDRTEGLRVTDPTETGSSRRAPAFRDRAHARSHRHRPRTVRADGSMRMPFMPYRSMTRPPSVVPYPGALWPPSRMESGSPCDRCRSLSLPRRRRCDRWHRSARDFCRSRQASAIMKGS